MEWQSVSNNAQMTNKFGIGSITNPFANEYS